MPERKGKKNGLKPDEHKGRAKYKFACPADERR